jgi:hypothetical protein
MSSPESFSTLKYPSELYPEADNFFPEAIKFTVVHRTGVKFDKVVKDVDAAMKKQSQQPSTNITNDMIPSEYINRAKLEAEKKGEETNKEGWKEKITKQYNQGVSVVRTSLNSIASQNSKKELLGSIYLNMPNSISLNEEAGWGGEKLGVVGSLTKNALKTGNQDAAKTLVGGVAGMAGNILAAGAGGIVGTILGKIPGVSGVTGGILGMIGGEVIQNAGQAAFSVTQNPYMEMMFSGVGFRQFKFNFIFRPRNKSEINNVSEIIKKFRQHSRPTWVGGADLGKSFMRYPQEFNIQFLTDNNGSYQENLHLPYLKPAVCSSVETNYTPDNIWAAYEKGAPVAITLGLSFQETELVMADDVKKDYVQKGQQEGRSATGMSEHGNIANELFKR